MAIIRKLERTDDQLPPVHVKRKKKTVAPHDESNWLISYADMMTLLCVFYIMMFSMSKINNEKFEKVKQEVAQHFGSKYQSPTEDLGKFVTNVIQENGVAKDVTITSDGVSVSLAFHSTLFFNSMSAEISDPGKLILDRIATGLWQQQKKNGKNYKIVIEGHTDAQPIMGGPFPSNWELSSARATRVIRLFLDDGFTAQNLLAIGYSDTRPVAESRNSDGSWNIENLSKNRRVVMRVLLPDVDTIPWNMKPSIPEDAAKTAASKTVVEPIVEAPVANAPAPASVGIAPRSEPAAPAVIPAVAAPEDKPVVVPAATTP
jgi:chemotaxis protein MotB